MSKAMVSWFTQFPEFDGQKFENSSYQEQKDIVLKMFSFAINQAHQENPDLDLICEAAFRTKHFTETDRETFRWIGVSALNSVNSAIHRIVYAEIRDEGLKSVSVVYFIKNGNRVKIGTTKDVQSRIKSFRVANPNNLKLLATIVGGRELERELHEKFSSCHIIGEWFNLSPDILDYIKPYQ